MLPKKSKMMDALYGENTSKVVYQRCQELSPKFNQLVQEVVYDIFWAKPGLTLKEKSLVTIISLITLNKEEQLQIHLRGFFNLGGTPDDVVEILTYMTASGYTHTIDKALTLLKMVASENGSEINYSDSAHQKFTLSLHDKALIDLSVHIALADQNKTEKCMRALLQKSVLSKEEIENVLLHQIVYCGFPCAMNGFAILKTI